MSEGTLTRVQSCLVRWRSGEAAARDELFAHADGRFRRIARKMLRDFDRLRSFADADDVVQAASIRLLRALQDVPVASAEDFFRLATAQIRRELLDLTRHFFGPAGLGQKGRPLGDPTSSSSPGWEPAEETWDAEKLSAWTEFHAWVERLPDDEKAVFELLWYQGLEQAEAASVLGVSLATVKRRWFAARVRIIERLPGFNRNL